MKPAYVLVVFSWGRFFSLIYPHFSNFSSKMGKVKANKSTPHFGSLPQGERRDERIPPHPTLSHWD
jgi:hypothetical protein